MGKQKIDIEYPLTTESPNIIWEQISSAHGLERWLADHVAEEEGVFTFTLDPAGYPSGAINRICEVRPYPFAVGRGGRRILLGDAYREESDNGAPESADHGFRGG